ncbi:hypothetical protein [Sphingobacterium sp. LRF_L2]|uniref:hypothetical protein n=1 Tax=Sphingobacterium sp. LRF_L2 TaxID=3369421 RepID=UPI003F5FC190
MKSLLVHLYTGLAIVQFSFNYQEPFIIKPYSVQTMTDGVVKTIDKRTKTDIAGNTYFLVFISKPTALKGGINAGHSFVLWGVEDHRAKISYGNSWGLYPTLENQKEILAFEKVPGVLKKEGLIDKNFNKLIVKVDRDRYDATLIEMEKWAKEKSYQLLTKDCLSFTMAIASVAQLKIPSREGFDTIPWNYLLQLIKEN